MHKLFIASLILTCLCVSLFAQSKYDEIINGLAIDIENGTVERINDMTGDKEGQKVSSVIAILNLDAFTYYGFNEKYTSDLQRQKFTKSKEYAEYVEYIGYDRNEILNNKYFIFYNLRYNNNYDVAKRAFVFSLGLYDWQRTHTQGYITIGKNNISTSFPAKRTSFTSRRDYYNELYIEQLITLPFNNDDAAIEIEKDMDNPYCQTYLVFEVSIIKSTTEKHPEMPVPQTFLLSKTHGVYIINKRNKSLYDVSGVLK